MVAIHIPRQADDEWAVGPRPGVGAGRPGAGTARGALPDRATRVRRRRLAALVLAVLAAASLVVGVQALAGLAEIGGTSTPQPVEGRLGPAAGERYVVQPGDTLWTIAERLAPSDDPRPIVDALRAANGGPELQVGSELVLDLG